MEVEVEVEAEVAVEVEVEAVVPVLVGIQALEGVGEGEKEGNNHPPGQEQGGSQSRCRHHRLLFRLPLGLFLQLKCRQKLEQGKNGR